MPKYRAQDFVAEALQQRRSLLDRMLVASPHHIEFVDAYVHRGQLEDSQYSKPWMLECFVSQWERWILPHQDEDKTVEAGLAKLLEGCCIRAEALEELGDPLPSVNSATSDGGFGSQLDLLLSQEIDTAMERHAPSSPTGRGSRLGLQGCDGEEFPEENMHSWECGIEPATEPWLLEPLQSPSHLDCMLGLLPLVGDLIGRLRPRLIQDPLAVDGEGRPRSHSTICSPKFSQDSPLPSLPHYEDFSCELLPPEDSEIDLVLGLPVTPVEDPLEGAVRLKLPTLPSPLTDLPTDEESLQLESREELKTLASKVQFSGVPEVPAKLLDFSPSERIKLGTTDFVKLNDANISHDSEDSGIGGISHAFLESPCLPLTSSPLTLPLSHQLGALEPLPLSPSDKLVLMSPASEQRFVKRMWEKEKVFDSILALTLPYPEFEDTVESRVECSIPPAEALQLLRLKPIKLDGDSELELPWDPLAESHREMTMAQQQLGGCPYLAEGREGFGMAWKERPVWDSSVRQHCEDVDFPISWEADRIHIPLQTDIPSLGLEQQLLVPRDVNEGFPCSTSAPLSSASIHTSCGNSKQLNSGSVGTGGSGYAARIKGQEGLDLSTCGVSALETFMMLRSGAAGYKRRASVPLAEEHPKQKKKAAAVLLNGQSTAAEPLESEEGAPETTVTSPTIQDVCLSGSHQSLLVKLERFAAPVLAALKPFGLSAPGGFWGLPPDRAKFFLKQQQKALEDSQGVEKTDSIQSSCHLAACLYVLCSVADTVLHCGITAGLGKFASLCERYEALIGEGLAPVKQEFLRLQLDSRVGGVPTHHAKLPWLVKVVSRWAEGDRRGGREKAVVVVEREFSSLSGDILDFLQSIPDLKSCVFSFAPNGNMDPLYLDAVEERFHHYDCLVMPTSSLASIFPWEKVGLLVEFEELKNPLFPGGLPRGLRLQEYITLRAVREVSASALADRGLLDQDLSSVHYTFMASENITRHTQLLQLLEGRHNMMVIERDYSELRQQSKKPKSVSYADLTLDASTGVVLRPLSLLSTDLGLKCLVNCSNTLSLQYQTCWVILFVQDESSYPFGGCVPLNLARLHASVAHYSQRRDGYKVRVLCASSMEEAAQLTRQVAEETHRRTKVWDHEDWNDRGWLAEEMTARERFLLSFPCLNTFSAQAMLRHCTLGHLLAMGVSQLQTSFPCIPEKVLKLFHRICNFNCGSTRPALSSHSQMNDRTLPVPGEGVSGLGGVTAERDDLREREMTDYQLGVGSYSHPRIWELAPLDNAPIPLVLDSVGELETSTGFTDNVARVVVATGSEEADVITIPSDDESEALTLGSDLHHLDDSLEFTNPVKPQEDHNVTFTEDSFNVSAVGQPSIGSFASSLFDQDNPANDNKQASLDSANPSDLELRAPTSPSFTLNGCLNSWSQPQEGSNGCPDSTLPFATSTRLHPLGFSATRPHKTPSQKEIRDTVFGKLSSSLPSGSALDASSNTTRLGREYYSGIVSSRFIAGSAARQTPARNPVKSLDLGFDSLGEQRLRLQSNDRAIAVPNEPQHTTNHGLSEHSRSSDIDVEFQSLKDRAGTLFGPRASRVSDLKSFHSKERQRAVPTHQNWDPRTESFGSGQPKTAIDSWLGRPCIMAKATRQKRPYAGGPSSDCRVPLATVSPPSAEPSLYGSPNTSTGSVILSPNRKRRLIYEKVPGSNNGQTRLSFR